MMGEYLVHVLCRNFMDAILTKTKRLEMTK